MAQILTPDDAAPESACQTAIAIWKAMGAVVDMWSANRNLGLGQGIPTSGLPVIRPQLDFSFGECLGDLALT